MSFCNITQQRLAGWTERRIPPHRQCFNVVRNQMVDSNKARRIGRQQAFKAVSIGLGIAYLIMALLAGPFWLFTFSYALTLIFAALVLYAMGFIFGGLAGTTILIRKWPSVLAGLLYGILLICTGTFCGSLVQYFNEGLINRSPISDPFGDYILK